MADEVVQCTRRLTASPDVVWAYVQDFTRQWHPDIDWMRGETGPNGAVQRRFAAMGGDKTYLEQLTYFSHSDKVLSYTLLEGIDGLTTYNAQLHVQAAKDGGANVTWRADIQANADRIHAISAGTKQIFDAGLLALADLKATLPVPIKSTRLPVQIQSSHLDVTPRLGISTAPPDLKYADIICLFLHGIGGQRGNWDAQLAEMGALIPSVSLDFRGYGDSALGPMPSSVDAYCADILAVADAFQAKKIILCGLSYGAWIATSFAMRHGDRLAGLVLAGGCTGMSEADPAERAAFRHSREVPLDAGKTPADFAPDVVKIIAGPHASDTDRAALFASMAAIPAPTYRDALACFTNPPEKFDFAHIPCPVLLMTGEHDVLAPMNEIRDVSQRMRRARQNADIRFEVVLGAGHVCNLEQPAMFNSYLKGFIEKVGGAADTPPSGKELRRREKHQHILDAALAEFSLNGFSGTSMQAIADRAGVSKPTLYQYFGQKDVLFASVLEGGKSKLLAPFENVKGKALVDVLWHFSWTYAEFVLHPKMLALARLIIGEAHRLPEVAKEYQRNGPMKTLAGIVAYLQDQKIAGFLQFEDAEMAAQHLWALILSTPREQHLHYPGDTPDQAKISNYITQGLRVFLAAYSTNPGKDIATLSHMTWASDGAEMLSA